MQMYDKQLAAISFNCNIVIDFYVDINIYLGEKEISIIKENYIIIYYNIKHMRNSEQTNKKNDNKT